MIRALLALILAAVAVPVLCQPDRLQLRYAVSNAYTLPVDAAGEFRARRLSEPAPPFAWGGAWFYSLASKESAAGALTTLTRFQDVLGVQGLDLELDAFAGATMRGRLVSAFLLGKKFSLAANGAASGYLGFGLEIAQNRPIGAGIAAGIYVSF